MGEDKLNHDGAFLQALEVQFLQVRLSVVEGLCVVQVSEESHGLASGESINEV